MKISVSEFKAKCTHYIRDVSGKRKSIEITRNGKLVAIVSPPPENRKHNPAWGCLSDTIVHITDDFDEPLKENEWEACQ